MLTLTAEARFHDAGRQSAIGAALLIIAADSTWKGDLSKFIADELVPAYRHGKLAFFNNPDGQPIGFVTWAHLSQETEERIIETLDPWIHLSEWNEGSTCWIRSLQLPKRLWGLGIRAFSEAVKSSPVRLLLARKGQLQVVELEIDTLIRLARSKRNY